MRRSGQKVEIIIVADVLHYKALPTACLDTILPAVIVED